jgi:stearoyl-CoA desaturase (delta-9 desaturase)
MYIRLLEMMGLAQVKKVAPTPRFTTQKAAIDHETLHAVITHRYDVLAKYAKSLKAAYREEVAKLQAQDAVSLKRLKRWLHLDEESLAEADRRHMAQTLAKHSRLHTVYTMRKELTVLWARSTASSEQLLKHLQDWCQRAEASGIAPLQEFALRLRCYA